MRAALYRLRRRLLFNHFLPIALLMLLVAAALWRTRAGGGDSLMWMIVGLGALAATAGLSLRLPGISIAGTVEAVRDFNARRTHHAAVGRRPPGLEEAVDRLDADLKGNIERTERAQQRLRTFLAATSHELNQPLATLRVWLEYAQRTRCGHGECQTAVGEALKQAERAVQLAGLLGQLAEAENPGPMDSEAAVAPLVQMVAGEARRLALARGLRLLIEAPGGGSVRGNPLLLQQAILNVVGNAIKYSPEGGEVRVCVSRDGEVACLAVSDQGPGIPREELERIFEPFYRGRTTSQAVNGHGLGLAIAKRIVEAAGGTIRVESKTGRGSCFHIHLPLVHGLGTGGSG